MTLNHYHVSYFDEEIGMVELDLVELGRPMLKWRVEDNMRLFSLDPGRAVIGEFEEYNQALFFCRSLIERAYPNAKQCCGAGCPPEECEQI